MILIKKWWETRSLREQNILKIGGIITAVLLGYGMIWLPLETAISEKKMLRETAHDTLIWMQQADVRLQQLQMTGASPAFTERSPLIAIQETLQQLAIPDTPSELTETEPNKVQLHFETVGFDALIKLLTQLWETDHLSVEKLNITKTNMPGVVQADITLTAKSAQKYTS